jgi:predicted TIM-barrel fold metal-dependent hydrolase
MPILQLYAAGVFDRHPNLRLVIARMGLSVASLIPRIEVLFAPLSPSQKPTRSFLDVWHHNFYVTTEDCFDVACMRALLERTPLDRVMYGANHPFEDKGKTLMMELKESGMLREEEWTKLASGNAERLFKLKEAARGGRTSAAGSSY